MILEKAIQLVNSVNYFRRQYLNENEFGLSPMLRRSSVSVAAYIAEAFETAIPRQKLRLLFASQRALAECDQYLLLTGKQENCNTKKIRIRVEQVSIQLDSYINALRK
jgi:four helix bundle protein